MTEPRINHDGRVFGENGEPDVFIPKDRMRKLAFVLFSLLILALGIWDLYGPMARWVFGEKTEGRIAYITVDSPGSETETIRIRREVSEGEYSYDTLFRYFVEVVLPDGNTTVKELSVASRNTPYASVNDWMTVVYFPADAHVVGLWQHRTWAFGCALLLMGLTFLPLSVYLYFMVGKPVVIDPEDPEQLRLEAEAEAREAKLQQAASH